MSLMESGRSKKIDDLKAIAMILVVLGHAFSYYEQTNGLGGIWYLCKEVIYAVHVPLFFVIAGYLCRPRAVKGYLWSKVCRILIPFYLFALLKVMYTWLFSVEFSHTGGFWSDIAEVFYAGSVYWFCYALFVLYLIAPLLWKRKSSTLLAIVVVLIIANTVRDYFGIRVTSFLQMNTARYYSIYFIAGMCMNRREIGEKVTRVIAGKRAVVLAALAAAAMLWIDLSGFGVAVFRVIEAFSLMIPLYRILAARERCAASQKSGAFYRLMRLTDKTFETIARYTLQIMLFDSFFKVVLFQIFGRTTGINIGILFVITALNIGMAVVCCKVIERIPYVHFLFGLQLSRKTGRS